VNSWLVGKTPARCCAICSAPRRTSVRTQTQESCRSTSISMANPRSNRAIDHLLTQLNAAEVTYA
jgi:hypothetical protein